MAFKAQSVVFLGPNCFFTLMFVLFSYVNIDSRVEYKVEYKTSQKTRNLLKPKNKKKRIKIEIKKT